MRKKQIKEIEEKKKDKNRLKKKKKWKVQPIK